MSLLGAAVAGDAAATLGGLQRFYDAGGDVRQLVRGLLSAIREAALLSVGYQDDEGLGGAAGVGLAKIGRSAGRATLLGLWKGLMEMEPELRKGADARLLLELTLLQNLGQAASAGALRITARGYPCRRAACVMAEFVPLSVTA